MRHQLKPKAPCLIISVANDRTNIQGEKLSLTLGTVTQTPISALGLPANGGLPTLYRSILPTLWINTADSGEQAVVFRPSITTQCPQIRPHEDFPSYVRSFPQSFNIFTGCLCCARNCLSNEHSVGKTE